MLLKSEVWVKAYLRRATAAGAMATIMTHGDDDAGTIFVKVRRRDGRSALFGPAPAGLSDMASDRRFAAIVEEGASDEAAIDKRLADERRFDPDVWLIEVEDREGRHFLDDWLVRPSPDVPW